MKKILCIIRMERKCIINPATGRAVKIEGRLGKKLNKTQKQKEDSAVKKLQAAVRRQTTSKPVETKTIEVADKKPRKPRGSGSGGGGRKKKEPVSVVKSASEDDRSDAIKKLQAAVKRQSATKKYDKEKDFRKAMGADYSKQKFTMTEKEKKETNEKVKKLKEEKNKKILGDKTAKDVFKIVKDYLDVWNFDNYKKSNLSKITYLANHQEAWSDVYDIVEAYGEEKLRKTLNEKDNKILDEYKNQAKLEGTLEKKIMLS